MTPPAQYPNRQEISLVHAEWYAALYDKLPKVVTT
jgi:hypothetical protein